MQERIDRVKTHIANLRELTRGADKDAREKLGQLTKDMERYLVELEREQSERAAADRAPESL